MACLREGEGVGEVDEAQVHAAWDGYEPSWCCPDLGAFWSSVCKANESSKLTGGLNYHRLEVGLGDYTCAYVCVSVRGRACESQRRKRVRCWRVCVFDREVDDYKNKGYV